MSVDKHLEEIKAWTLSKISKNPYRTIECLADLRKGGRLSVDILAKTSEDKTLFLDMDSGTRQSLENLLLLKMQSEPDCNMGQLTLIVQSPGEITKCELITDIEKSQQQQNEVQKQKAAEYTSDCFGPEMAKLIVETLHQHGKISRCYNPRDGWHHALWLDANNQYVLGETFEQNNEESPRKTLRTEKEFVDWFKEQSPQSLYQQGLPWKKGELLEAIRLAPYLKKSIPK